ncbi:flagellar hook-basal body complex protein [Clostridium saccharobutylicum]|uniref:flagellar hook-basal body complex protein n=1 Tax=Clostridium saccharobutylicum TaxID=169679 RepID=UPI0007DFA111|nr:flagellar hook-basal body complex protein [Clostridium saccharobutylicum]OAV39413.1 flagellar basal body rod protein [Clostridium saccharobutylicum DSM 13864]
MIRGFYTSLSGLITLQNEQETITNNIANVNNTGYKKRELTKQSFEDVMISNRQKLSGDQYVRNDLGTLNLGVKTYDVKTAFTQGTFKSTGNMTDFAISGRGFFVAQSGNKEVYTRDGNFKIDQQGYLITNDGSKVLGVNNTTGAHEPIYVGDKKFSLDADNNINIEGTGATDKLLTADFSGSDYKKLEPMGDNYITDQSPTYNAKVDVTQNTLEGSNVDSASELIKLMLHFSVKLCLVFKQ